jgi:hypothetical protein
MLIGWIEPSDIDMSVDGWGFHDEHEDVRCRPGRE